MDALHYKGRIAKFLFAFRYLDKIVDNGNGTQSRLPKRKNQTVHAKAQGKTFQQVQKQEKGLNGIPAHDLFLLLKKEGYDINLMYQSNPEEVLQKINKKYHPLILKHFAKVDENMEQERKLQEQYKNILTKLEQELAYQSTWEGGK